MKRPLPGTRHWAERKKIPCDPLPPAAIPLGLISCEIFPDEVLAMAYIITGPFLATALLYRLPRNAGGLRPALACGRNRASSEAPPRSKTKPLSPLNGTIL